MRLHRSESLLLAAIVALLAVAFVALVSGGTDDTPRTSDPVPTPSVSPLPLPSPTGPPALVVVGASTSTYAPGSGKVAVRLPLRITGSTARPVAATLGGQAMTVLGSEVTGTLDVDCAVGPQPLDLRVTLEDGTVLTVAVPAPVAAFARACSAAAPVPTATSTTRGS